LSQTSIRACIEAGHVSFLRPDAHSKRHDIPYRKSRLRRRAQSLIAHSTTTSFADYPGEPTTESTLGLEAAGGVFVVCLCQRHAGRLRRVPSVRGLGEIKRMYVVPSMRGGVWRAPTLDFSKPKRPAGLFASRSWKTGRIMTEALGLYLRGWREIPVFGPIRRSQEHLFRETSR